MKQTGTLALFPSFLAVVALAVLTASNWPVLSSLLNGRLLFGVLAALALAAFLFVLYLLRRVRQLEQEARYRERSFCTYLDAIPDLLFIKSKTGELLYVNQAASEFFVGERLAAPNLVAGTDRYRQSLCGCRETDELVFQTGEPLRRVEVFVQPDGSARYVDMLKVPVVDALTQYAALLVLGRDITDQKRAELDGLATKELLESFLQQTPDAISLIDINGRVKRVNQASEIIFGYSEEELIDRPLPVIPPHLQEEADYYHQQVLNGKRIIGLETIRFHKSGRPLHVSLSMAPIYDVEGKVIGIAGSARDITERKRVEHRLRVSEAKYRLIAENMTDMICVYEENGAVTYMSPSHESILGYPLDQYKRVYDCLKLIHPDDRESVRQAIADIRQTREMAAVEFRFLHSGGHWVHLESRCKPIVDETGRVISFMIVTRDITEKKRAEELLRQSDMLSAVGQLAAGIAHEIRNPLTALRGFIQLMQSSAEDKRYCGIMLSELDRINLIVSELLLLAKPQAVKYQQREVGSILKNVLSLLDSQAILNNIQIHTRIAEKLPPITCEENQMKQVFINLCKNAIEAMPNGGHLRVEAEALDKGEVRIRIKDTGCGIDPERIPRLGEPFYTTKEKGTGLGLMVSRRIIEEHGGRIAITSEPEQGTTVDVILPALAG
ncbi:PAS domain-containing sensor histidine kinase [Brevibacillus thermoruber]|jgi:two-component system, sporulation sensor kinase A|uniref:PAS domain-containing sensor histidine kinase n=1 Tax=Brevibacillus thermoruber TaxID=33942 RepID=UPI000426EFF0|nr:PAS domain-containing sensor histidine kinase [Brevibacillus thermoruber]